MTMPLSILQLVERPCYIILIDYLYFLISKCIYIAERNTTNKKATMNLTIVSIRDRNILFETKYLFLLSFYFLENYRKLYPRT